MERISLFFVHMNIELHFDRWKVYELSCRTMDHRITESLRWEMSSKIPKFKPIPTMPTDHVPQCHFSVVLDPPTSSLGRNGVGRKH